MKLYRINGVADVLDAVEMFALERCEAPHGCPSRSCHFFSWCPKALRSIDADHAWAIRADRRRAKIARDKARRAR